jgi:hypothetical protein
VSPGRTPTTGRAVVDELLGRDMTREIWTGNYAKALPLTVQDFDLSAVLPAAFYMFRFGHRRGKGKFLETFGSISGSAKERKRSATIERVASALATTDNFRTFDGEAASGILGDLLLCFCLENAKRALGRREQIQRVAPAHYMASWVDLPEHVANLRYVPEMIVAMLANQKEEYVQPNRDGDKTWFAVGRGFEGNVLLRAFHQGVTRREEVGSLAGRTSDRFEEETTVGLDQLLMIRLAQELGAAPDKLRGSEGERISNQRPIAEAAAQDFSEDIRRFVRSYAAIIPRHAFVELLESCIAVGLTTILTSVVEILCEFAESGEIRKKANQKPASLFVDCSNGVDRRLRLLAEQSLDDFMRRIERIPVILMALRLLDRGARYDPKIKALTIPTKPYATAWLNMLGQLLHRRRPEADAILYDLERKAEELAEKLEEDYPECSQILKNVRSQPNAVWRLAESLTSLQGRKNTQGNVISLLDSTLLVGRPNGLALKRAITRNVSVAGGTKKRSDIRSLIFTDSILDYLVHIHVLPSGNRDGVRRLSFREFIQKINDRFGFCVDTSPSGMSISNDLLQANRAVLERRLRDLGLLVGVNDAESMKRLRPRFTPASEDEHGMD